MLVDKQVKVRFSKSFSSPTLGNVWDGREVTMKHSQAMRFVELEYAAILDGKHPLSGVKVKDGGNIVTKKVSDKTAVKVKPEGEKTDAKRTHTGGNKAPSKSHR